MRTPAVSFAVLVSLSAAPAVVHAQDAPQVQRAADALLEELHRRGWFNGAVVLGGEHELYARGFGKANVAANVPFTPDTPADGGSIAKTFAAASIMMLLSEGRLALDSTVQRYLPEYPHAATTVRHLLSHAAGLPAAEYDFFNDHVAADAVRTTELHLRLLRELGVEPEFTPGSQFQYSSLGFDVAASIVERITHQTWDDVLRQRVFEPLDMRSTFLRPALLADWSGVRTIGYRRTAEGLAVHDVFDREGFYGGSNLYISARDLYRWSRSFYTSPVLTVDAKKTGEETPLIRDDARGIGGRSGINLLGWYANGRRYHYPGSLQGFWVSAYRDEGRKYAVAYVSNNSMPQWLRPLLTRWLIDIIEGRAAPVVIDPPEYLPVEPEHVPHIAESYTVEGVGRIRFEREGQRLRMRVNDGLTYNVYPVEDRQLYVPGLDVWIGFPADTPTPYAQFRWLSIFHVADGTRTSD